MAKKPIYIIILSVILYGALCADISHADLSIPTHTWTVVKTHKAWITAYSSSPDETDNTPFTTASGTTVRDGIIAVNFLPMGTKVKIPALFGDKIFTVEDRMHKRKKVNVDVWMPSKRDALIFGAHVAKIEVIEEMELFTMARN